MFLCLTKRKIEEEPSFSRISIFVLCQFLCKHTFYNTTKEQHGLHFFIHSRSRCNVYLLCNIKYFQKIYLLMSKKLIDCTSSLFRSTNKAITNFGCLKFVTVQKYRLFFTVRITYKKIITILQYSIHLRTLNKNITITILDTVNYVDTLLLLLLILKTIYLFIYLLIYFIDYIN